MSGFRNNCGRVAALALLGAAAGCATNPVTGQRELMLVAPSQEVAMDREASPHQFSSDYGLSQDAALNAYVDAVGQRLVQHAHRRDVAYSFRVVNAVYANAYAFPGGSIAVTRGLLAELTDESQLAALLGHEMAHINYRHTARAMTRGALWQTALSGVGTAVQTRNTRYSEAVMLAGQLGGAAFLSKYSRDQERQADQLGMDYMVAGGYDPRGMVDLMDVLVRLSGRNPSAVELLFATHPMSRERLADAKARAATYAPATRTRPREAFEQRTAGLRAAKPALQSFQKAEQALGQDRVEEAKRLAEEGLRQQPNDYAGLLVLAACERQLGHPAETVRLAQRAAQVYPSEAHAHRTLVQAEFALTHYQSALSHVDTYDRLLPGDPTMLFLRGYCHEKLGQVPAAAQAYERFLQQAAGSGSPEEQHARARLSAWTASGKSRP